MTAVLSAKRTNGSLGTIIVLGFLLALAMLQIKQAMTFTVPSVSEMLAPPEEKQVSRTVILQQIRRGAKLVTASASGNVEMPWGSSGGNFLQRPFYKDHMILLAYADVMAGLDLEAIRSITEEDIRSTDHEVVVYLPPPKIMFTRLDNKLTHVVYRDTGWVKNIFQGPAIHLEGEARREAENVIEKATCQKALDDAADEGQLWMQSLVQGILRLNKNDHRQVRVVVAPGHCA